MISVPSNDALPALENRMNALRIALSRLADIQNKADAQVKQIQDRAAAEARSSIRIRDAAIEDMTAIFQEHRGVLLENSDKTLVLVNGTLSARFATEALEIVNEAAVEKYLRRKGVWRKYTKLAKRQIDKTSLKKDRSLVEGAKPDVMRFVQAENLIFKLPKLNVEIKRKLNPLRTQLNKD